MAKSAESSNSLDEESLQRFKEAVESWRPTLQIEATDPAGVTLVESLVMISMAIRELASAVYGVANATDAVAVSGESIAQAGREISESIDHHG